MVGREVVGRADDFAVAGVLVGVGRIHGAGQTEVRQLGVALRRDEHVSRLHVAVHDALLVGLVKPFGDLRDDVGRRRHAQRTVAADQLPQIAARHVLGDEEVYVPVPAGVDGPHELRMIQTAEGLDFAGKIGNCLGRRLVAGKDLDGDHPLEDRILGLEDVSHSSLAERVDNAVRPQGELGPAVEQLLDLPRIEKAQFDDLFRKHLVCGGGGFILGAVAHRQPDLFELLGRQQPAGQAHFSKLRRRLSLTNARPEGKRFCETEKDNC